MGVHGRVTAHTVQGPRLHHEDRHLVERIASEEGWSGYLLAVMDGHGGSGAAEFCRGALAGLFAPVGPEDAEAALKRAVARLHEGTQNASSGTTIAAVCILETHGRASVAVLGDSPVFVIDRGGALVVSPVHNARINLEERRRALTRGAVYEGGYLLNPRTGLGLQVSRALGDAAMDEIVAREPDTYSVELGPESLIVLATDGIVDMSEREAGRFVREALSGHADAENIVEWAERRGLRDNATAVVWRGLG